MSASWGEQFLGELEGFGWRGHRGHERSSLPGAESAEQAVTASIVSPDKSQGSNRGGIELHSLALLFPSLPSTMDTSKKLLTTFAGQCLQEEVSAAATAPMTSPIISPIIAIVAREQTQGRGRGSREWHSPADEGLYLTVGLLANGGAERLQGYTLAVGVALARVLERGGIEVGLKWPNDLVEPDPPYRKVGGILVESVLSECVLRSGAVSAPRMSQDAGGSPKEQTEIHVGIGINFSTPSGLPTALGIDGVVRSWAELSGALVGRILNELVTTTPQFISAGLAPFRDEWLRRSVMSRGSFHAQLSPHEREQCTFHDLDEHGGLVVERESGELATIRSSDVSAPSARGSMVSLR